MHTPGPWTIHDRDQLDDWLINIRGSNGYIVAAGVQWDNPTEPTEEEQANAHLIAAAPELLTEAELFVEIAQTVADLLYTKGAATRNELEEVIAEMAGKFQTAINKAKGG